METALSREIKQKTQRYMVLIKGALKTHGNGNLKMIVKFKKLVAGAVIPKKAHKSDAGFDLVAVRKEETLNGMIEYGTGLAVEIPAGHVGLIFPRSSIYKHTMTLTNSVGVIDSGYRGEIKAVFDTGLFFGTQYQVGDRVMQMIIIPYPEIEFVEAEELSASDRGANGYGSTGDK